MHTLLLGLFWQENHTFTAKIAFKFTCAKYTWYSKSRQYTETWYLPIAKYHYSTVIVERYHFKVDVIKHIIATSNIYEFIYIHFSRHSTFYVRFNLPTTSTCRSTRFTTSLYHQCIESLWKHNSRPGPASVVPAERSEMKVLSVCASMCSLRRALSLSPCVGRLFTLH